jgi:hypothetical protein
VSHLQAPLTLNGELDENDWLTAARTGAFTDEHGEAARPFSEARFLWDEDHLYVGLYAADDNLQVGPVKHDGAFGDDDAFVVRLTPVDAAASALKPTAPPAQGRSNQATYEIDFTATGVVIDARQLPGGARDVAWESKAKAGVDRDGTLNDARDKDEEWIIEGAIPLRAMNVKGAAGTRFEVAISRCDTPRGTTGRRCGSFGGAAGREGYIEFAPPK